MPGGGGRRRLGCWWRGACLAVGSAALLAGCGGSPPTPVPSPSTAATPATGSFAAYRSCLAAHGVHLPRFASGFGRLRPSGARPSPGARRSPRARPSGGAFGPRRSFSAAIRAALAACRSARPVGAGAGGFGAPGGFGGGTGPSASARPPSTP